MRPAIEKVAARVAEAARLQSTWVRLTALSVDLRFRGLIYQGADIGSADIIIQESGRVDTADASADLVLSFQVLEHVRDVGQYLGEALRILRDDGWLILSTHGTWLYHPHPEDHRDGHVRVVGGIDSIWI